MNTTRISVSTCKKYFHNETLDALLLTHVDDDHIGGVLANLRFSDYVCPYYKVWMNYDGDGFVGDTYFFSRQNDEVYARLLQRGIKVSVEYK